MGEQETNRKPLVRVEQVKKAFGDNEVLRDVSLTVDAGEVVCLLGSSGAGKSTLLRAMNRLETIDDGQVWVDEMLIGFARNVADRVVLMHHGTIIEDAKPDEFFDNPKHERTRQFLSRSEGKKDKREEPEEA